MMISALVFVGCAVNKPTTAEQNTQKHCYANRQTARIKARRENVLIIVQAKGSVLTRRLHRLETMHKNARSAAAI